MKSDKVKIAIGAPTYNSVERLQNLLTSIEFYTDYEKKEDYKIVILDDGTPDLNKRKELAEMALRFNIEFIQHEKNEGIPKSWNDLTSFYNAELVILLNDDVEVCNPNWLKCFVYFMDNNPKVGNAGFPIIHIDPATRLPRTDISNPDEDNRTFGKVGSPNGCCFGFRKELWKRIVNPDGSVGYWNSLLSFYEEISFGFEISKMGYYCVQLATPLFHHLGSLTFGLNPELSIREIGEYITREEYLAKLRQNTNLWIPFERHEQLALKENYCLRMDYARMMFAKYWGCKDFLSNPQEEIHSRLVDKLPKIMIKYLDKDLNEKECEI